MGAHLAHMYIAIQIGLVTMCHHAIHHWTICVCIHNYEEEELSSSDERWERSTVKIEKSKRFTGTPRILILRKKHLVARMKFTLNVSPRDKKLTEKIEVVCKSFGRFEMPKAMEEDLCA